MATCKWCLNECEPEFLAEVLVESKQDEDPYSRTYVFHIGEPCLSNYAPPVEMILSRPRGQETHTTDGSEDISEPHRYGFYLNNLRSMLAVAISRMLFESSGYEVRQ